MNKKLIQKEYKKKINSLNKLNEYYYDKSKPLVSDSKYDELKNEILLLEQKYLFLKSKKSPSNTVGHKPSKNFKKFQHRVSMLSLSNAFSKEDLINFEKKIFNFLSKNDKFIISYKKKKKIDGISASLTYENGIFRIVFFKRNYLNIFSYF